MKMIKADINWNLGYANKPELIIHVDEIPSPRAFFYQEHHNLYYAELDNCVSFFSYKGPGNGYGGAKFTIMMDHGSTKDLIGPWSSRAGVVNAAGLGPCMDVQLIVEKEQNIQKNGEIVTVRTDVGYAGHVTLLFAMRAAYSIGFKLKRVEKYGSDVVWELCNSNGTDLSRLDAWWDCHHRKGMSFEEIAKESRTDVHVIEQSIKAMNMGRQF